MDFSFIIRKAVIEDAAAIKEVMQEAFSKYIADTGIPHSMEALDESVEDIEKDIATKNVFIAIIDNIPVGSIRIDMNPSGKVHSLSILPEHYKGSLAYITRFGVKLDYHNIGIGKALMNVTDKFLRKSNINWACLHTASTYTDLVRFYYGRGFYIHSTSVDRGYIRALMLKEL